jgi:hypothetical protein
MLAEAIGLAEYHKKILHYWQLYLLRQCAVVGLAEYQKNYIPGGHVCGGNVWSLVRRSIIKKFTSPPVTFAEAICHFWSGRWITGSHVCRGNVQLLVWQSIIKKIPSLVVMFSEAMLAEYHKKIYITNREEVAEALSCCIPKYSCRENVKLILTDHYKNLQRQSNLRGVE